MIARLLGEIVEKDQGTLVLNVNGVGYEVMTSSSVSSRVGNIGSQIDLVIYTDVRETAIVLYGFNNKIEKQTFLLLKKVKGIGSKIAMVILSVMSPEKLMIAIGQSDTSSLTKVPGIGKKSAERIIVELREQVSEFVSVSETFADGLELKSGNRDVLRAESVKEDAILALQKLGFNREVAVKAVKSAISNNPKCASDTGELLKQSLAFLG